MTLTIGRVTITQNPSQLELNGDRLDVGGWFFGTDLNQAKVLREQLIGLDGNEDEPDVPVTWTYDAKVDGYYTIKSVAVSHIMGVAYEDFKFQYAATLERVEGGFAAPLCELAAAIAVRTNAHAVTVPIGNMPVPSVASFKRGTYSNGRMVYIAIEPDRVSATGSVVNVRAAPAVASFISMRYAVAPADYYDGAAMIEQSVGGVWYPVVGDQISNVTGNLLRIGNGLVRFTFHTDGVLSTEVFDGSVWESATSFQLTRSIGSNWFWLADGFWRIVKNAPDACTIQTAVLVNGLTDTGKTVTLHLARGRMMVEIAADGLFFVMENAATEDAPLLLRAISVTASTAITGGIRQTTNNGQGHRWLMVSPSAVTKDTTNGSLTIAAPGVALVGQFGLGWERDGSTGGTQYDAVMVADEYFAAIGTQQRVVAR